MDLVNSLNTLSLTWCLIGLVNGFVVLQLLERGPPPEAIRIVDFRAPTKDDIANGPASEVEFLQTDIRSAEATTRAFTKPWPPEFRHLPLTVFHAAAVNPSNHQERPSPLPEQRVSRRQDPKGDLDLQQQGGGGFPL